MHFNGAEKIRGKSIKLAERPRSFSVCSSDSGRYRDSPLEFNDEVSPSLSSLWCGNVSARHTNNLERRQSTSPGRYKSVHQELEYGLVKRLAETSLTNGKKDDVQVPASSSEEIESVSRPPQSRDSSENRDENNNLGTTTREINDRSRSRTRSRRQSFPDRDRDRPPSSSSSSKRRGSFQSRTEKFSRELGLADEVVVYEQAAAAILAADYLLVAAGAGFSADSGLPVYKDIADVPAYRDQGLTYSDLCNPIWISRDPEIFFGFWGSCFNSYMDTSPHEGYAIVRGWRDSWFNGIYRRPRRHSVVTRPRSRWTPGPLSGMTSQTTGGGRGDTSSRPVTADATCMTAKSNATTTTTTEEMRSSSPLRAAPFFVYTSNVDTLFAKAGLQPTEVHEIHGNITQWQCSLPCCANVWTLPSTFRFEVSPEDMRSPPQKTTHAPSGDQTRRWSRTSSSDSSSSSSSSSSDQSRRWSSHASSSDDSSDDKNHIRCPLCNRIARPNILMFEDDRWISVSDASFRRWERAVRRNLKDDPSKRLVIIEGGCGLRVPTVRYNSDRLLRETADHGTVLIRINPDHPQHRSSTGRTSSGPSASSVISIRDTCLNTLRRIDQIIQTRRMRDTGGEVT